MKELVVISGKGGTGKTSLVASFAVLAADKVVADCDVDAPDLPLVLEPNVHRRESFVSGREARIRQEECVGCGLCWSDCRFQAIVREPVGDDGFRFEVDPVGCEGCGVCARFCPVQAIAFEERLCGEWYASETRHGPLVHARLRAGAENSGKLVTVVRDAAREIAEERGLDLVLVDGSPGIGCPVIASVTGASLVLVVTEPTVSGAHDLERVLALTGHFAVPTAVCVNKFDVNPSMAAHIEEIAQANAVVSVGRIGYDPAFTEAQVNGKAVVECPHAAVARDVRAVWENLCQTMS